MKFNLIDMENYPRKTHFDFYMQEGKSSYNLTANLDITDFVAFIKKNNFKFYPVLIFVVSKAMNSITELRIRRDELGRLGCWDYVSPAYNIFHDDDKTFSCIYTEYNESFSAFYKSAVSDMDEYKNKKGICPKESPENCFHISCVPWLQYTGASLHMYNSDYLKPLVFWGKYSENNGRIFIPFTLQTNHLIADGYHASLFINMVQKLVSSPESL